MSDDQDHTPDNDETPDIPPPPPGAADDTVPPPPSEAPRVSMGPGGAAVSGPPADTRNFFQKIPTRLKIVGAIVIIGGLVGFISSRGKTDAEDLKAGDCFEEPTGEEIFEVKDQDCDGVHEAEILTTLQMPSGTTWPGSPGAFDAQIAVEEACLTSLDTVTLNDANIPADAWLGFFFSDRGEWNGGDREVLCYVSSESGLPGRVLAGG